MVTIISKYAVMIIIAAFLTWYDSYLNSNYLEEFFKNNAILLAITIFTIHSAAVGILLSQLQIIKQVTGKPLNKTIDSIKKSFIEIFILIFVIVMFLITIHATCQVEIHLNNIIINMQNIKHVIITLISASIIDIIYTVYDTNNAILMTFKFLNNQ